MPSSHCPFDYGVSLLGRQVVDQVVNWAKFKQDEQLKRKGGSKRTKVLGITKLDDANFAGRDRAHTHTISPVPERPTACLSHALPVHDCPSGTAKSSDCTLILTEGTTPGPPTSMSRPGPSHHLAPCHADNR